MQIEIDDELALNILDHARAIGNSHGTIGPLLQQIADRIDPLDALAAQPGWYIPALHNKQVWFTSADYRSSVRVQPYPSTMHVTASIALDFTTPQDALEAALRIAAELQPGSRG